MDKLINNTSKDERTNLKFYYFSLCFKYFEVLLFINLSIYSCSHEHFIKHKIIPSFFKGKKKKKKPEARTSCFMGYFFLNKGK